ncbi:MAG: alpha/beta hydrolase [Oscillospiraceae bacterium]|jgi:pimeloyl-ACP methyl ester carboxylesterase|nr:alpha/beta hydrolase [Oscillospiraceae bacterium]
MTEKTYPTPCGEIRYWTSAGPEDASHTLVFLPGLTADHRLFEKQLAHFSGKYPLLVWDAPGHAASRPFRLAFSLMDKAAWLREILAVEQAKPPVLIGQSMGGYVGQAFLEQFPGQAAGFVSIDSAPLQRRYVTAAEIWLLKRTEPIYRIYPWQALLKSGSNGCAVSPYGRALMWEMMSVYEGDQAYYARLSGHGFQMLAEAMEAGLPYEIDCPALLLCGRQDRAGSTRRYNRAWHKHSGLPLVWLENAGHNSNTDQPEQVNALLSQFVESLSRKGAEGTTASCSSPSGQCR